MKLSMIWTLEGMALSERLRRTRELLIMQTAHHLPRRLAYWSLIDSGVRYMESNEVVPEVPFTLVLERAGRDLEKVQ